MDDMDLELALGLESNQFLYRLTVPFFTKYLVVIYVRNGEVIGMRSLNGQVYTRSELPGLEFYRVQEQALEEYGLR